MMRLAVVCCAGWLTRAARRTTLMTRERERAVTSLSQPEAAASCHPTPLSPPTPCWTFSHHSLLLGPTHSTSAHELISPCNCAWGALSFFHHLRGASRLSGSCPVTALTATVTRVRVTTSLLLSTYQILALSRRHEHIQSKLSAQRLELAV